jgi:hypothetical protein
MPTSWVDPAQRHGHLQQDVGDETLFDLLHRDREEDSRWYRKAITLLVYFQRRCRHQPPFTGDFFFNELEMTRGSISKTDERAPDGTLALKPLLKLADNISDIHTCYVIVIIGQNIISLTTNFTWSTIRI